MAKNISLMGADYPDVPAVQLPQTGGGKATFYDIEVVDNLNSDSSTDALSAKQGKILNGKITSAILTRVISTTETVNVASGDYASISFVIPSITGYTPILFFYNGTASSALAPTNGIGQFVYSSPRTVIVKNVTSSEVSGSITFNAVVLYVKTDMWGGNS